MTALPQLPADLSQVLLALAFLVPPLYLLLVDVRDGKRSRLYRRLAGTGAGVTLLATGLIVWLVAAAGGGLAANLSLTIASTVIVGFVVLPVSVVVWLLFAFSLARKITQKPQPGSSQLRTMHPETWLMSGLFIALIFLTIYFGWQNRGRDLFQFDPTQIFRGLLSFPPSLTSGGEELPKKEPSPTPAQLLNLYTHQKFGFAFSYPDSINLYHVNGEKEDGNLLRIFFESKEKGETTPQDNQRNSNQQLFQSFMGMMPRFFGGYFNRDTRPVIHSLTFYVKSKSRSENQFDVSQKVRAEFCKEESFTLSDLKVGEKTGLKIVCDRYNLYLLTDPYQPRQYFVLTSRLSSLIPTETKPQKEIELEKISQTIIGSLTYLEPLENWTKYENKSQGYSYLHPKTWKNREICPTASQNLTEASPSAQSSSSAQLIESICERPTLTQVLSHGYFVQSDKALFMVETGVPTCFISKSDRPKIFLDGRSADVEERNGEKIISLKANNLCYQITLQARTSSPLRPVLEQILSTLKFEK